MAKKLLLLFLSLVIAVGVGAFLFGGCIPGLTTPSTDNEQLAALEEAWEIIFSEYVDQANLDADKLLEGAINGMLEALDDPYTAYLNPDEYQFSLESLEGTFEGIGAYVGVNEDDQLVIIAPIAGSPAEEAGIRAGDIILEVDGMPTADMSMAEAIAYIRGPKGTPVALTVLHESETEPEEIVIVRAEIELESVFFEMRDDVAYIYISNFNDRTDSELTAVLNSLNDEAVIGIIIDMRSNPGGLLSSVVDVASHFLKGGIVVYVVDNEGGRTDYDVESQSPFIDLPIVVLVDSFSASGSEVLSGVLQDRERAVIAGSQTFGKGSVNLLIELENGSGIYITTARWYTPDGNLIEGEGITPDIIMELTGEDAIQWAVDYLKTNN